MAQREPVRLRRLTGRGHCSAESTGIFQKSRTRARHAAERSRVSAARRAKKKSGAAPRMVRSRCAGLAPPVIELACRRQVDITRKFTGYFLVKAGIVAKPDVHAPVDLRRAHLHFPKPEPKNRIDAHLVVIGDSGFHAFAE